MKNSQSNSQTNPQIDSVMRSLIEGFYIGEGATDIDVHDALAGFTDEEILNYRGVNLSTRVYALALKRDLTLGDVKTDGNSFIQFDDRQVHICRKSFKARKLIRIRINITQIKDDLLHLEGELRQPAFADDVNPLVLSDGKQYSTEQFDIPVEDLKGFDGQKIQRNRGFSVDLPLVPGSTYELAIGTANGICHMPFVFERKSKLSSIFPFLFLTSGKTITKLKDNKIEITRNSFRNRFAAEFTCCRHLIKLGKWNMVLYRLLTKLGGRHRKPIWIISDRTIAAGDNGEAFFKYCQSLDDIPAATFFLLDRNSSDFDKVKKYGKVLANGSFKYKRKFLQADMVISSQTDLWVTNAFVDDVEYVRDLLKHRYINLRHGIIKDDISGWLWKQRQNIDLFVTTAEPEYRSILECNYLYDDSVVKLTGLPRFDLLEDRRAKVVLIMPTWRKGLSIGRKPGSSEWMRSEDFRNTEYCRFYNSLINDDKLLSVMAEKGYTGEFYIHPIFFNQAEDFHGNNIIKAHREVADYRDAFARGSLLVTDFSSVFFDFAYLGKPVVYSQFDANTFFKNHNYTEGYFSYTNDGFGPVCYNYEDTVNTIIDYIKNDCLPNSIYIDRADRFFKYRDRNNCSRVYNEIINLANK